MRKLIAIIFWLFSSLAAISQTTAVTATITDSDSTVWINPQWSVQFVPNPNFPQLSSYSIGGVPITSTTYSQYIQVSGTGNGSGVISTTLLDNNQILPVGSKYRWVVQSQTSAAATTYLPVTVTGASQSLTSYLSSNAVAPRFSAAAPGAFGYADVEISVVPQPGGLYYNTVAANQRIWNGTAWGNNGGNSGGPAYVYLSASSELGAQCVTALATLGATGGVIQFPNSSALTMTTTCANIPQQVSFKGYGKIATKIQCTVAGACFQVVQNPTTNGEIGGKFSDFEIDGNAASGQILTQCVGCSGWTWDNVQFQPYGVHSNTNGAVCLQFDNTSTGTFIEGNTILPSVYFERACGPSVYLHDASADTSFAYNHFWLHLVSEGTNYGVIVDGNARVYGGMLEIFGNHVGPGGGILEFNGGSGTGGPSSLPTSAFINIMAEESGSGAGVVLNANTTGTINFNGTIMNGPGGAFALATTIGGSGATAVQMSNAYQNQGGVLPYKFYATSSAIGGVAGWAFDIVGAASGALSGFVMDNTAQAGGHIWSNFSFTNQYAFFDQSGSGTQPFNIVSDTSAFKNLLKTGSLGQFCWGSTAQYATSNTTCDTGISRSAAGIIKIGNGTQNNDSGTIDASGFQVGGVAGVTKTCTSAIVVVAGIITGCT